MKTTAPKQHRSPSSPHLWVSTTYFAEGFPYAVVHQLAEILFRELGASLQVIGLTSLLHLPYNLKFLWAPLADGFATKRSWLLGTEVLLAATLVGMALMTSAGALLGATALAFAILALASATHDIAVDGYYLEALDERNQSKFVGYRAMAYKIATTAVAGPLVILVGRLGWLFGLLGAALVMSLLFAYHFVYLPHVETARRPAADLLRAIVRGKLLLGAALLSGLLLAPSVSSGVMHRLGGSIAARVSWLGNVSGAGVVATGLLVALLALLGMLPLIKRRLAGGTSLYARAFVDFLDQPRVGRALAFVILFRVGESFLLKMRYPFLRQAGMTLEEYGWANGGFGGAAAFVGTLLGGWLIARHGLHRWIWPMVVSQNMLNLLYALLALPQSHAGLPLLVGVISFESFGAGLGTAALMVYIMRCCRPQFKAAHMAILTALMSVSFTVAGVCSGFLASSMGYGLYFLFTFIATLPAMILIPFVPHLGSAGPPRADAPGS
ncbi:MAG: MFS transporter [Polyangiaceae bacterium]|nr:MFS transporter [Polyangiaceae bacterium]